MTQPDRADEILAELRELLDIVNRYRADQPDRELLPEVLSRHLGCDCRDLPVVEAAIPEHRYADYDLALELLATREPDHRLVGVGGGEIRHMRSLADLLTEGLGPPARLGQLDLVSLATGPDTERACLALGMRMFRYDGAPVAVLQRSAHEMTRRKASLEVLAVDRETARRVLAEVRTLATEESVLRGQVLVFEASGFEPSTAGVTFPARPRVAAEDVILPDGVLDRIREHVLAIGTHRDALRVRGQHLKRGVLLYGPPGAGKTHTVRHLVSVAVDHTVVLLAGETLRYVSLAASVARALQPAIVVLEDCDLVAEHRDHMAGAMKPLLFEVLDAMDGLDADADVTFLLTTNRLDIMEPALAQRPGRVDLAVEIPLPDQRGREALLRAYAPTADTFSDPAAAATPETTASFAREVVRRAVLQATLSGQEPTDQHLADAAAALMAERDEVAQALAGAQGDATNWPPGIPPFGLPGAPPPDASF